MQFTSGIHSLMPDSDSGQILSKNFVHEHLTEVGNVDNGFCEEWI